MNAQAKLIEKIKALLRIASESMHEEEAMRATEAAQMLLTKHNLTAGEVQDDRAVEFEIDAALETDSRPWRRIFVTALARLYFCEYIFDYRYEYRSNRKGDYKRYDKHVFLGAPHNVAVVKLMFEYLCAAIDRLAREAARKELAADSKGRSAFIASFRTACAMRLQQRIVDRWRVARSGEASASGVSVSGSNLPALASFYIENQKKLAAFIQSAFGETTTVPDRSRASDSRAYEAGTRAGDSIGLESQVSGHSKAHALPKA